MLLSEMMHRAPFIGLGELACRLMWVSALVRALPIVAFGRASLLISERAQARCPTFGSVRHREQAYD
jgi:hypothetical protein